VGLLRGRNFNRLSDFRTIKEAEAWARQHAAELELVQGQEATEARPVPDLVGN
jgi:hypothetical protein